jgi:hypothetical protein
VWNGLVENLLSDGADLIKGGPPGTYTLTKTYPDGRTVSAVSSTPRLPPGCFVMANDDDPEHLSKGGRPGDPHAYARQFEKLFPGRVCTVVGTNCFVSTQAAIAHCQGDWAAIKAKLASGEIRIGEPALAHGEALVLLARGRWDIKIT